MMDSHSNLAISHESRFVSFMARNRKRYEGAHFRLDRFLDDLSTLPVSRSRFFTLGLDQQEVERELSVQRPQNLGQAIQGVFRVYARARGKGRWGDKTPGLLPYAVELADMLPDAKFIHVVRDGRDVAAASRDAPFGPKTLLEAALHWQRQISCAQTLRETLNGDHYLEVRYEELVSDPEAVLRAVCHFCGVSFEPTMLSYVEPETGDEGDYAGQGHHGSLRKPLDPALRDWRRDLSEDEIAAIEYLITPGLRAFGYEVGASVDQDVTPVSRAALSLRRGGEAFKNPFRRARRRVGDRVVASSCSRPLQRAVARGRS